VRASLSRTRDGYILRRAGSEIGAPGGGGENDDAPIPHAGHGVQDEDEGDQGWNR